MGLGLQWADLSGFWISFYYRRTKNICPPKDIGSFDNLSKILPPGEQNIPGVFCSLSESCLIIKCIKFELRRTPSPKSPRGGGVLKEHFNKSMRIGGKKNERAYL